MGTSEDNGLNYANLVQRSSTGYRIDPGMNGNRLSGEFDPEASVLSRQRGRQGGEEDYKQQDGNGQDRAPETGMLVTFEGWLSVQTRASLSATQGSQRGNRGTSGQSLRS